MSESKITKKAIAESLKQLMKTIPLSKISIKDIVSHCGLNRQTFYYHFKDKYALVNWVYYNEAIKSISDCSDLKNWSEGIYKTLMYFQENKRFYVNALNTPGQNAFDEYLFEVTHRLIINVVNDLSAYINLPSKDRKFIADFYSHAFVGCVIQWIKNGMKESPEIITERMKHIVDGSLTRAVDRFAYK